MILVGGGLAGLTAATAAREAGAAVELHEMAGALGGRAPTADHDRFDAIPAVSQRPRRSVRLARGCRDVGL